VTVTLLVLGLLLLLGGGAALVNGASGLARHLGVPPLVIGLTIVAFGTSAPELVINLLAAVRGTTELAFGNVVGSNLANIGLVLGLAAFIHPMTIKGELVRRELPLLLLATAVLLVMVLDGPLQGTAALLTRSDGLILLLLFGIFAYVNIMGLRSTPEDALISDVREAGEALPAALRQTERHTLLLIGGTLALGVGGHVTITQGTALALQLGVSPALIGLGMVAVGTSLPELVTSVTAALKNESDLCLGNVIGSNLFNSLFVLPLSAVVRPIEIPAMGEIDIVVSFLLVVAILPVFFFGDSRMNRLTGLGFLAIYGIYMGFRLLS
jgi:cation:H+ antiporter